MKNPCDFFIKKKKNYISLVYQRMDILLEVGCIFMGTLINQWLFSAVWQRSRLAGWGGTPQNSYCQVKTILFLVFYHKIFLSFLYTNIGRGSVKFGFWFLWLQRNVEWVNKKLLDIFGYLCYTNNNFNSFC